MHWLWGCVLSYFGSLFGGQNKTLSSDMNNFGQIGGFATGLGESNLSKASGFFSNILSGDPSKIAKSLGPEISSIQTQTQQQKKTNAEFGNRSGGTNAANQSASDKGRGLVTNMIASLLGSSASSLASTGGSLLSQGAGAYQSQLDASQVQMQNWSNSILGMGLTTAAGTAEGFALGKV
jgi:hypothetical protein